jgi:hypothetical protein
MNFFESTKKRMPHFFDNVDVLEYVPHNRSKSIKHLFLDSRYFVLDPSSTDLSEVKDNSFNVVVSVNNFQNTPNYLDQIKSMHRVSSKFIIFSCSTAGRMGKQVDGYYKNLTYSDFYNYLDMDSMFDSYKFDFDYDESMMYFWAVKRSALLEMDKV